VVEHQSLSLAAAELGMGVSAVSKHLQQLEEHMNTRLVSRNTRSLCPTPVGDAYFQQCKSILAAIDEAERSVCAAVERTDSVLRISVEESAQGLIGWLLQDVMRGNPATEIRLRTFRRGREVFDLKSDFTVLLGTGEPFADASVILRPLFSGGMALYTAATAGPAASSVLISHDLQGRLGLGLAQIQDALAEPKITTVHQCPGLALSVELVRQGIGCAVLPDFLVRWLGADDFRVLATLPTRCELYLSYYERELSSRVCREFVEYACG